MGTVRYMLDLNNPPSLSAETLARLDTMTPEEIEENARNDPDNPPLTDDELDQVRLALRSRCSPGARDDADDIRRDLWHRRDAAPRLGAGALAAGCHGACLSHHDRA